VRVTVRECGSGRRLVGPIIVESGKESEFEVESHIGVKGEVEFECHWRDREGNWHNPFDDHADGSSRSTVLSYRATMEEAGLYEDDSSTDTDRDIRCGVTPWNWSPGGPRRSATP
jgi:uncharacterized protein YodC (DUF2158 family)